MTNNETLSEIISVTGATDLHNGEHLAICPLCNKRKLYINKEKGAYCQYIDCQSMGSKEYFKALCEALHIKPEKKPYKQKDGLPREHIYTDAEGNAIAKKTIQKYTNGEKSCMWYSFKDGKYIPGLQGEKMPLYHLHQLNNSETVYVVEGEKDVETLENIGYTATTSPNGAGKWEATYTNILKGKKIIILADNDDVGRKHGELIAQALTKAGLQVKLINSIDIYEYLKEKGDISDIVKEIGKDNANELLIKAVENTELYNADETNQSQYPDYIITDTQGIAESVQPALLSEYIRNNSNYIFVRSDAKEQKPSRYWYKDGAYREITDDELKGFIKEHITKYGQALLKMRNVEECFKDITTDLHFVDYKELNADENIINFENGLLYLDTMELKPHTPDIYTTIQIPCKWTGSADATPVFDKFINDFTSGNDEIKHFLLQYMGMCISNVSGYYPKKALFIVGDGNTGKTQLLKLTIKLLGEKKNCVAASLKELEERFGTADIENKRLTYDPDMKYATLKELAVFKQITGGDYLRSEAKYKSAHSFLYRGLLWFCMNELPKFGGDRGQWVYDRMIILKSDNVIPEEKRDAELINKMYAEREAIVYKAVMALKEVIKNGYRYNVPQCCINNLKQYQQDNSPVLTFFNECCIMREQENGRKIKDSCTTKKMYEVFKAWCKDNNGGYVISKTDFNKEIVNLFNVSDAKEIQNKIHGMWYYTFTLSTETKSDYQLIYGVDNIN